MMEKSVRRGEFTLSSGRKSSYYIDARRTTMSSLGLALIGELGLAAIRERGWEARAVGGLTLGADPVAYAIALASQSTPQTIDAFTVRKDPKAHGTTQLIEGGFESGMTVVIVEDVLTTGGSALRAADAVRQANGTIIGVLCVVDREEGGADAVRAAGYAVHSLIAIQDLRL